MTQDKMRKIITACVSAATVLFLLLLSYLIYQWVTLSVLEKREQQLEKEIAEYTQAVEEGEEAARWWEEGPGRDWLTIKYGYELPTGG